MPRVMNPATDRIARAAGYTREQVRDWSDAEIRRVAQMSTGRVTETMSQETEGAVLASGCAEELRD